MNNKKLVSVLCVHSACMSKCSNYSEALHESNKQSHRTLLITATVNPTILKRYSKTVGTCRRYSLTPGSRQMGGMGDVCGEVLFQHVHTESYYRAHVIHFIISDPHISRRGPS